jgi:L-ascorbate metabolism protein UlaG (beta-lactamase superfamily)
MIEPQLKGHVLVQDIDTAQPGPGEVLIWWLGQSGFAIKTVSALFYLDLYLSEHLTAKYEGTDKPHIRMTAAPLRVNEITGARWVFASHKHSDHLDPGTLPALFAASPEARLVLPAAIVDHAVALGLPRERLIPTRGDETLTVGPMTVHAISSAHPDFDYDGRTGYPFLGYVVEIDNLRLYHSGDTLLYPGLAERLDRLAPDVLFLPINGTNARLKELQVPPNMSMEDAIVLAQLVGRGKNLLIPHHYDMFTFNTADINDFRRKADAAGVTYAVLECGKRFSWRRTGGE